MVIDKLLANLLSLAVAKIAVDNLPKGVAMELTEEQLTVICNGILQDLYKTVINDGGPRDHAMDLIKGAFDVN